MGVWECGSKGAKCIQGNEECGIGKAIRARECPWRGETGLPKTWEYRIVEAMEDGISKAMKTWIYQSNRVLGRLVETKQRVAEAMSV